MTEQINSPSFFPFVDYLWSPREDYDYALSVIEQFPNIKLFTPNSPPETDGVIFMGMNTLQEDALASIPTSGRYIVISRDNDRPFTEDYYKLKKSSIQHIYTVNCSIKKPDVTAIPVGHATISGFSDILEGVMKSPVGMATHEVFCRLNLNASTDARSKAINDLRENSHVYTITEQLSPIEFFIHVKRHSFNMALESGGKDTLRTWESLYLGTVPIVSDCIEMRHFEDMSIAFYPGYITVEWLKETYDQMLTKNNRRSTMSYWREEIIERKACL